MQQLRNRGRNLEYMTEGEGIPFIFLHGLGGSVKQILSAYEPIEGIRLITMNQQGHGGSDAEWDTYDFDSMGDDVIALMDSLNLEQAYFAGISMGAAVCLNAAVRFPERVKKLMLIRNAWTDRPMSEAVQNAYYDLGIALRENSEEGFWKSRGGEIVSGESAYTRGAFEGAFADDSNRKNWKKYLILPKKTPIASVNELMGLSMPVTILANKNDFCHPFAYGEYLAERIPGAVLKEIPDKDADAAGHKKEMNKAIQAMLQKEN